MAVNGNVRNLIRISAPWRFGASLERSLNQPSARRVEAFANNNQVSGCKLECNIENHAEKVKFRSDVSGATLRPARPRRFALLLQL